MSRLDLPAAVLQAVQTLSDLDDRVVGVALDNGWLIACPVCDWWATAHHFACEECGQHLDAEPGERVALELTGLAHLDGSITDLYLTIGSIHLPYQVRFDADGALVTAAEVAWSGAFDDGPLSATTTDQLADCFEDEVTARLASTDGFDRISYCDSGSSCCWCG